MHDGLPAIQNECWFNGFFQDTVQMTVGVFLDFLRVSRKEHDGRIRLLRACGNGEVVAAHFWHVQVSNDEVERVLIHQQ